MMLSEHLGGDGSAALGAVTAPTSILDPHGTSILKQLFQNRNDWLGSQANVIDVSQATQASI